MDQCLGCLGTLFGSKKRRKQRLRYMVNYNDGDDRNLGVEFENLVLSDENQQSYGTNMQIISSEERDFVARRQYDKIIEEQKKVDEQIGKQLFEEEDLLRVEEEAYYEAQREAARAASQTLSLKEKSSSLSAMNNNKRNSLTLEEVEDDFEDFLEEVRNRSIAFRSQYSNKSTKFNDAASNLPREHVGDGQSSDDEFLMNESSSKQDVQEDEWDNYTSGLKHLPPGHLESSVLEKRLDPVGVGSNKITKQSVRSVQPHSTDKRIQASRMFSITDDEDDMGDFVRA